MGEKGPEGYKINAIVKQIEAKAFETRDQLKVRRLEQARISLREIDSLIKQLASYGVKIDPQFQKIINLCKDVVFGRKSFEEAFNVKIVENPGLPEKYVEDWKAQEKAIIAFANSKIRGRKFLTPEKIKAVSVEIESFVKELDHLAIEKTFASWVRTGFYSELYKAIKGSVSDRKLSGEMAAVVGYVLDQALVFEGGDGGADEEGGEVGKDKASGKESEPVALPVDPLLIYNGKLEGKFKLPTVEEAGVAFGPGILTADDFFIGIEEEELPADVLEDLKETLGDIGDMAKAANPWQEALLNLFAVYVIKPAYQAVKEHADWAVVRYSVRKLLLKARREIGQIFATPKASAELIVKVLNVMRVSTVGLADVGIKVFLDGKFEGAADMVFAMVKELEDNDSADKLTDILKRSPDDCARWRMSNPDGIVRLSALTFLLLKLKEENRDNKPLLIGLQFAISVLIRLRNDAELLQVSSSLRGSLKGIFSRYKTSLTEVPFAKEVSESELSVVLRMIFPDAAPSIPADPSKMRPLNYLKVEQFLSLVSDLLVKDPGSFSKYNAVIVCLMENIRQYMHDENAREKLIQDIDTLRSFVQRVFDGKEIENPFVKLIFDNPLLVRDAITVFYKEPDGVAESSQLGRLKTIFNEIIKENGGNKVVVKALQMVILLLDGFESDKDFFANIGRFEKVLDTVLFGREFVGLKMSPEARTALKSIVGYAPIIREAPDVKIVSEIAGVFGNFGEFADKPLSQARERILTLMTRVPQVLKLNYVLAGFGEGLKLLITKVAGASFGVKEQALFDYLFANYRDYLCDKYDNSIEKFLLNVTGGNPPEVEVKTENLKKEAMVFVQIGGAALNKIGISKVYALAFKNLMLLAQAAKARLKRRNIAT
ncbi:hypothetical protein HY604_03435 [Candidatus Peregrinibacteria bacterium]|nr:hypothetical protein [Candidatus Peregrinibacteria bacterium]